MSDIETGSPWRCFSISSKRFISSSICPRLSRIVMLRPVGNSKDVRRSRRISKNSWLQNRHLTIVHGQHEISENLKALNFNYTIYLAKFISTFFSTKKDQKKLGYFCLRPKKLLGNVSLHLFPQLVLQPGDIKKLPILSTLSWLVNRDPCNASL